MSTLYEDKLCHLKMWLVLCLQILTFHLTLTIGDDYRCKSTFHVWQPGQDAQRIISEIYLKMDNVTSYSKLQVAELKAHLSNEVNRMNNWTYALDKRVMEMEMGGISGELAVMKQDQGMTRLQSEIDHTVRRLDDLASSVYSIRSKLNNRQWSKGLQRDQNNRGGRQRNGEDLNLMLKDSIGDLKAEWLLLKRDVERLKKEEKRQRIHLQELKDEGTSLKSSLEKANVANKELKNSSSTIKESQVVMQGRMDILASDTLRMQHLVADFKISQQEQRDKLASVESMTEDLESRLNDLNKQGLHTASKQIGNSVRTAETIGSMKGIEENTGVSSAKYTVEPDMPAHLMKDCQDVYRSGFRVSGVYHIKPDGMKYALPVYCLIINATGYTVFQRRLDGTINFNRRWMEYRQGFGNPYGEIWMGNEFIHHITKQKRYILRVDLWDWEGHQFYAEYTKFWVEGESDNYSLHVGDYSGTSGDSLSYHNKMAFSTEDVDNDLHQRHCGAENKGGWWYNSCFLSQLNGLYHTGWYAQTQSNFADGTVWYTLKNSEFYSLRRVEMSLKPLEM